MHDSTLDWPNTLRAILSMDFTRNLFFLLIYAKEFLTYAVYVSRVEALIIMYSHTDITVVFLSFQSLPVVVIPLESSF